MTRTIAALAAAAALALAGCSTAQPPAAPATLDDTALASQMRAAGIDVPADVASWRAKAQKTMCDGDEHVFSLSLTFKDVDAEYLRKARALVSALCPDRVHLVDDASAALRRA